MAISGINSNIQQFNSAMSVASSAIKLAQDLNGGNAAATLSSVGKLFQNVGNLVGGSTGSNASQGAAMSNKVTDMAKLFGNSVDGQREKEEKEAASAATAGGATSSMSLGKLLAIVGGILVKSIESTMKQLQAAANELDGATKSGGPTAALNQKIQELTFNLQQIQQTLNRVNETVTNLSRSQSDAQKSTAQNLSV